MEYKLDRNIKIKTKKLDATKKKKLLDALERCVKIWTQTWNLRGYLILKNAIKSGEVIVNPNVLTQLIGTPVGKGFVGYEHTLNLYVPEERLVVEIPKETMYKDSIGYSSYKV